MVNNFNVAAKPALIRNNRHSASSSRSAFNGARVKALNVSVLSLAAVGIVIIPGMAIRNIVWYEDSADVNSGSLVAVYVSLIFSNKQLFVACAFIDEGKHR